MRRELFTGLAAGAIGTVTLNLLTYADMAVRGRPASTVPAEVAGKLAASGGIDLAAGEDGEVAANRKSGVGALLGYVTGLGVGAAYGIVRSRARSLPLPFGAVALSVGAMAGSDIPATATGVTDPRSWGAESWLSDIVPHLAYGVMTALAYEAFSD